MAVGGRGGRLKNCQRRQEYENGTGDAGIGRDRFAGGLRVLSGAFPCGGRIEWRPIPAFRSMRSP